MLKNAATIFVWLITASMIFSLVLVRYFYFLPSPWYSEQQVWVLVVSGIIVMAATSQFGLKFSKMYKPNLIQRVGIVVGPPVLAWTILYFSLFITIGGLHTILMGTNSYQSYSVRSATYVSSACGNAVDFVETTWLANNVCDVETELRNRLKPGDIVCVSGWSGQLGVFPKQTSILSTSGCGDNS